MWQMLRGRNVRLSIAACAGGTIVSDRCNRFPSCNGWMSFGPFASHERKSTTDASALRMGKYFLGRTLGTGAYGVVKVADDPENGVKYAIKIVPVGNYICAKALEREVEILKAIGEHRSVVGMVDNFETSQHKALVMELLAGGEVFEHICDEGPYSERDAAGIVREVCEALKHMHSRGVCHRDLKPENLLLVSKDEHASVKVCDFGLATFLNQPMTDRAGSVAYMAPEVHEGDVYNASVDMWSLGVLTYILLAGYHPFDISGTGDDMRTRRQIVKAEWNFDDPSWAHVSDAAKEVITMLLQRDPSKRPTPEQLLAHPWVGGEAATTHPLPNSDQTLRSFNENRKAWRTAVRAAELVRLTPQTFEGLREGRTFEELPEDVVSELKSAFNVYDRDGSGSIDALELQRMFHSLGVSADESEQVLRLVDTDGSGAISFVEFCAAVGHLAAPSETALRRVFEMFDMDKNDSIDRNELRAMLTKLRIVDTSADESVEALDGRVDAMFRMADTDRDGTISFEEFSRVLGESDAESVPTGVANA